jgi:hypothetical protein
VSSFLTIGSIILSQTSSVIRKALIKASITWDYSCYLFTEIIIHMHVSTLTTIEIIVMSTSLGVNQLIVSLCLEFSLEIYY